MCLRVTYEKKVKEMDLFSLGKIKRKWSNNLKI